MCSFDDSTSDGHLTWRHPFPALDLSVPCFVILYCLLFDVVFELALVVRVPDNFQAKFRFGRH